MSDPFTKEKLIYYTLQLGSIVNFLHNKGLATFASLQLENLMIDPITQKIKFSSPFIQYLKAENDVRGSYGTQPIMTERESLKKKDVKAHD